jgi:multidrug efflux system membrane fusion protein
MKKRNIVIIGAVIVLAAGGIFFRMIKGMEKPAGYETRPAVSVETPGTGDIVLYTDLTGTVEPQSRAAVMPKIGGEVLEVYFQAGDQVQEGQALCRIDSDALTSLKLQMESARVAMDEAAREAARIEPLYAQGYVSQQAMEQARDGAASARLSYESAKHQYDQQLEYTTVTATISGTVEARNVEPHDHVSTEKEICVISSGGQSVIKFGITEKNRANLAVGDAVSIMKNGTEYSGRVTEISSMVSSSNGLYNVKAEAARTQAQGLASGTKVKLTVIMDRAKGVMTVPVDAVNYTGGQPFVYCYVDGRAEKTMIESGIYDSERMEVKSGLEPDSRVITSWSNELVDGAEVLLVEGQQEAGE